MPGKGAVIEQLQAAGQPEAAASDCQVNYPGKEAEE